MMFPTEIESKILIVTKSLCSGVLEKRAKQHVAGASCTFASNVLSTSNLPNPFHTTKRHIRSLYSTIPPLESTLQIVRPEML
jgi:hypothetical protein